MLIHIQKCVHVAACREPRPIASPEPLLDNPSPLTGRPWAHGYRTPVIGGVEQALLFPLEPLQVATGRARGHTYEMASCWAGVGAACSWLDTTRPLLLSGGVLVCTVATLVRQSTFLTLPASYITVVTASLFHSAFSKLLSTHTTGRGTAGSPAQPRTREAFLQQ